MNMSVQKRPFRAAAFVTAKAGTSPVVPGLVNKRVHPLSTTEGCKNLAGLEVHVLGEEADTKVHMCVHTESVCEVPEQ